MWVGLNTSDSIRACGLSFNSLLGHEAVFCHYVDLETRLPSSPDHHPFPALAVFPMALHSLARRRELSDHPEPRLPLWRKAPGRPMTTRKHSDNLSMSPPRRPRAGIWVLVVEKVLAAEILISGLLCLTFYEPQSQ